jgi:uncharacterized protein (TIGR02391 family)
MLQFNIDDDLWNAVSVSYQNGNYTGAIRDAFIYLTKIIREKSDLDEDGVLLINKAFSGNNPKIRVNKLETTSDTDIQKGIANTLRGVYQFIRNPRNHDEYKDTENDCIAILSFIQYLLSNIKDSTEQFEIDSFLKQISDKRFVCIREYCDALIYELDISDRKFLDTVLTIYKKKLSFDINNLKFLFVSIYTKIKPPHLEILLKIMSGDLKRTSEDREIIYIVSIIKPEMWQNIDKIAKIRIEHRIMESLKEAHYLATWCTRIFPYFEKPTELCLSAISLIDSRDSEKIKFFYDYIFKPLIALITEDDMKKINEFISFEEEKTVFIFVIKHKMDKGELLHLEQIKSRFWSLPEFIQNYLNEPYQNYMAKLKKEESTKFFEDVPF